MEQNKQYIVGHRGAMGLAPENTLKSFRIGCENGADVVECDIHLSKDKRMVVIHDNTLDRTTNGTGWVRDYTFEELKKLDAGGGEKIPALKEMVDLVMQFEKRLIVEIKGESFDLAKETAEKLIAFLRENPLSRVLVHSFWHDAIRYVKTESPQVKAAVIMMVGLPPSDTIALIERAGADGAAITYDYISAELIELAHSKNLFIDAWVLDYPETFIIRFLVGGKKH
jgi:glycerophosphoryl diester phosphodiesterase